MTTSQTECPCRNITCSSEFDSCVPLAEVKNGLASGDCTHCGEERSWPYPQPEFATCLHADPDEWPYEDTRPNGAAYTLRRLRLCAALVIA